MPTPAAGRATPRRRLALPLTSGLVLWGLAGYAFALPGAYDDDGIHRWALATSWAVGTAGAALALVCSYLLARRLEEHLTSQDRTERPQRPAPRGRRRPSAATVLVAAGASTTALVELLWLSAGPLLSWVFVLVDVLGRAVAPAVLALGVYLALRRLEDHLAGRHRTRAPTAPDAGRERHASGLTTPYVRG